MKKYFIQTFGCQMNEADSEKINMMLLQSGCMKVSTRQEADIVLFNTCSVRKKGEDRVYSIINEIKKVSSSPYQGEVRGGYTKETEEITKKIIAITGCMVRKTGLNKRYFSSERERITAKKIELLKQKEGIFNDDDKLFPKILNLDFTLRIEEIKFLPLILSHIYGEKIGQEDKFADYLKLKQQRENPASASVIIQTGCDNYCAFCIVPHTRGKEMSRPMEEIVAECKEAVKNGAKEITLLGQNVNSYGKQFVDKKLWNEETGKWKILAPLTKGESERSEQGDLAPLHGEGGPKVGESFISPFRQLLNEINAIEGLERIRFTSSNPHDMTQDILDAHFELPKMCNYLHFALQSGSNAILKKMNRKHTFQEFKNIVQYLRSRDPLFSISTDIIVGFSGETEEMFEETLKAFDECLFDFAYNARYSVRVGTLAAKLYPDDIPDALKAERWHRINNKLEECVHKRNEHMLGRTEEVMINGEKDNQFFGRTRNFKEVFFDKKVPLNGEVETKIGDIVTVKIKEMDKWVLKGERVYY